MRVTEPYTIFLRKLPSGRQVYYYQYRDEYGRRSYAQSTGCTKLSQAKRYCNQLYNEGKMVKSSELLFKVYASNFFDDNSDFNKWKKVNNKSITPSTLKSYVKVLNNQIMPYFENIPLNKVTTFTVKDWIIWMSDKWSAQTSNHAQTVLNIILKTAYEKKLIRSVPSKDLSFRNKEKKKRVLLTVDEIKKIYHSNLWSFESRRKIFLMDCITGMRIGELLALQPKAIFKNYLNVTQSYDDTLKLGDTKTKMHRYVPIPEGMFTEEELFRTWIFERDDDPTQPILRIGIYKNLLKICESLGINCKERGITVHTLRNFFISYLQYKNIPEPKIRAIVGHSDESMTELYTYWKPDMFPEVYEAQLELYKEITSDL